MEDQVALGVGVKVRVGVRVGLCVRVFVGVGVGMEQTKPNWSSPKAKVPLEGQERTMPVTSLAGGCAGNPVWVPQDCRVMDEKGIW